jgi:hypothetical protein
MPLYAFIHNLLNVLVHIADYTSNLVGSSFVRCLQNCLLSGCSMRFTNKSFLTLHVFQKGHERGGHAVVKLVKALCYKPEGSGFDSH